MTTALHHDRDPLRKPMMAVGAMLLAVVVLVAVVRIGKVTGGAEEPGSPVVAQLSFVVEDAADGSVRLIDRANGRELTVIAPEGEQFFRSIRQVMRRERTRNGGGEESLTLRRRADGAVEFLDEASGFILDVRSFGSQNDRFFSELLNRESTTP
jgi:putative photosynthetic complex assembly protein